MFSIVFELLWLVEPGQWVLQIDLPEANRNPILFALEMLLVLLFQAAVLWALVRVSLFFWRRIADYVRYDEGERD